jgi:hypothetical protein
VRIDSRRVNRHFRMGRMKLVYAGGAGHQAYESNVPRTLFL